MKDKADKNFIHVHRLTPKECGNNTGTVDFKHLTISGASLTLIFMALGAIATQHFLKVHKHEIILNFFLPKSNLYMPFVNFRNKIFLLFLRFLPEF
jgi:hypothetical protein